jgi:hypothetical protein
MGEERYVFGVCTLVKPSPVTCNHAVMINHIPMCNQNACEQHNCPYMVVVETKTI